MRRVDVDDTIFKYELPSGEGIIIELDDWGSEAVVKSVSGQKIGSIEFSELDGDVCKIAFMDLDNSGKHYLRKGIGREVLKCHKEYFGSILIASQNDGIKQNDGSHLTGDAPGFIQRMRDEGIVYDDVDRGGY